MFSPKKVVSKFMICFLSWVFNVEANTNVMINLNNSNYHIWNMEDIFYMKDYYLLLLAAKKPNMKIDV